MKQKKDLLMAILANQCAIADAFGINIPFPVEGMDKYKINPIKLLTPELADLLNDERAFLNAFEGENPILSIVNGKIVFNDSSEVLYAYLLSRLFTDDFISCFGDSVIWNRGTRDFPQSALSAVFKMDDQSHHRRNRLNLKAPRGHERVDNLFDKKK